MAREYPFLFRSIFTYIFMEAKCFVSDVLSLVPIINCSCVLLEDQKLLAAKHFQTPSLLLKMLNLKIEGVCLGCGI
jgi:hypothetical protein